ncbi:MAG: hypothetical protein JWM61_2053 [Micrococcaceae bacterium]|nr:hypothetical protein [Micrococcaceae bacterium]
MPDFAILIYADESLHALEAAEADLEENDQHARDLQASGSMSLAYALTPSRPEPTRSPSDTTTRQPALLLKPTSSSLASTSSKHLTSAPP